MHLLINTAQTTNAWYSSIALPHFCRTGVAIALFAEAEGGLM